jgi:flagellar protein FliJ
VRKYHFTLQTALELRIREEEQEQRRLARAQRLARDRRRDLERTRKRHHAMASSLRGGGGQGATVALGELEHAARVLADLRGRMNDQQRRLEEAESEVEARRTELVEASRARRTLERLSEQREAEHRREEQQREQREWNEAAISRHRRGSQVLPGGPHDRDLDHVA